MLGKKRNLIDRIFDIEYIEIPRSTEKVGNNKEIEIRHSKSNSLQGIVFFSFVVIIAIHEFIKAPYLITKHPISSFVIFSFVLGGLITFLIEYYKNQVVLRLTVDTFEYKSKKIYWRDIQQMYLKGQSGGIWY